MGMIVDCYLVEVKMVDGVDGRGLTIKQALKDANDDNHQYGIEIPDDMAMALSHTGHIEYFNHYKAVVRCYKINWDETEKLRQSQFKFGD